jgi:hypothetical protein
MAIQTRALRKRAASSLLVQANLPLAKMVAAAEHLTVPPALSRTANHATVLTTELVAPEPGNLAKTVVQALRQPLAKCAMAAQTADATGPHQPTATPAVAHLAANTVRAMTVLLAVTSVTVTLARLVTSVRVTIVPLVATLATVTAVRLATTALHAETALTATHVLPATSAAMTVLLAVTLATVTTARHVTTARLATLAATTAHRVATLATAHSVTASLRAAIAHAATLAPTAMVSVATA